MDRASGSRCNKKGANRPQPETGKLDIMSNFERVLKEIVRRWKRCDDMEERAQHLLSDVLNFGSVKFRVARSLSICRDGLKHGAWMPLVKAIAVPIGVSGRTIRRWVAEYEENKDKPDLVLVRPVDRGPDLAAQKNLEIARGTHQALMANSSLTQEEAHQQAVEQEPLHWPPPPAVHPLTSREQWISEYVEAGIRALAQVPENDKEDVIEGGTAELYGIVTKRREPITITPTEPTVDRSGRRRQPEPQPEPEPQPQIAPSEAERTALEQWVQTLIESATELTRK
jgi:hypothetical protein